MSPKAATLLLTSVLVIGAADFSSAQSVGPIDGRVGGPVGGPIGATGDTQTRRNGNYVATDGCHTKDGTRVPYENCERTRADQFNNTTGYVPGNPCGRGYAWYDHTNRAYIDGSGALNTC